MAAPNSFRACPFCGVATDVPHETQEGCIEALQAEIAWMRQILECAKLPGERQADEQSDPN